MYNLLNLFKGKNKLCDVSTPLNTYKNVEYDSLVMGIRYLNFDYDGRLITLEAKNTTINIKSRKGGGGI